MFRPYLFFTLDHEFYITTQQILLCHDLKRLDVHVHLSFIIARTTGINLAVFHGWLKGWRGPQIKRIGGLHIVMTIDQHRWFFGISDLFPKDNRMTFGLHQFHFVGTGLL